MKRKYLFFMFFTFVLLFTFSFSQISVMTSIPPIGYAVQQIGGNLVKVEVLTHAGDNPHTYSLMPRQVVEISKADVFVDLGLKEDEWIAKKVLSINPKIFLIQATSGFHYLLIGENGNYNPHVWLDVNLYEMMCANIYYNFAEKYPKYSSTFAKNFGDLVYKLEKLNKNVADALKPYKNKPFIAQHPAWDYFARAYGLGKEYSLENNAGQSITPKEYKEIIVAIQKYKITHIIGDPVTPSTMTKSISTQSGVKVINVNPIYIYDYFDLISTITQKFVEAFQGE